MELHPPSLFFNMFFIHFFPNIHDFFEEIPKPKSYTLMNMQPKEYQSPNFNHYKTNSKLKKLKVQTPIPHITHEPHLHTSLNVPKHTSPHFKHCDSLVVFYFQFLVWFFSSYFSIFSMGWKASTTCIKQEKEKEKPEQEFFLAQYSKILLINSNKEILEKKRPL